MYLRCANHYVQKHALALCLSALLALVSACSSSPTKETIAGNATQHSGDKASDKASATKADGKNAAAIPEEAIPAGPPPVPPEATQQYEKALTLLSAGDYAAAAKDLQRLSETYPEYSGPMANLGIVYLKTGKLAEAEKALKAATQRGEPSAAAFNQLGIVYRKLGRFKEADAAYSEALRIDPGYALAHLNLGVLCDMYLQQPQRALSEFERYLQLVPNPDVRVSGWVKELRARVGVKAPAADPAMTSGPAAEPVAKQ